MSRRQKPIDATTVSACFQSMASVAFDTLKLSQRLEAAGFPPKQAQDMASAISDAIIDTVVTREYLDLRIAELKTEMLKWMFGAVGLQTLAILGGMAALLKLLGH
jgi:hypothetical protein